LIAANLRLVLAPAKAYTNHPHNLSLDEMDLIQEGNVGLINRVGKETYRDQYNFSTFVGTTIRGTMQRAIENGGTMVRVPVNQATQLQRLRRMAQELERGKGRAPTLQELAKAMSVSVRGLEKLMAQRHYYISLSQPLSPDDPNSETVSNLIGDRPDLTPEALAMARERDANIRRVIARVLRRFNRRYGQIFRMRYELELTIPEITAHLGIPRSNVYYACKRIRKSLAKALKTI
jgi:RNA polymerase primary sigma factor